VYDERDPAIIVTVPRNADDGEHVDEQREYEDDDEDLDAPARSGVGCGPRGEWG
jgi:hypothetical protein